MDTLTLLVGIGTAAAIGFTFYVAGDVRDAIDTGLDDYLIEDAKVATRKDRGEGATSGSDPTHNNDARTRHGGGL